MSMLAAMSVGGRRRTSAAAPLTTMFYTAKTSGDSAGGAGTTYYVDSVGGNDALAGTSTGTAWKNWSKIVSFASSPGFGAGSKILLKRGSTFTDSGFPGLQITFSGTAGNPITIGAYGAGNPPVITSSRTTDIWGSSLTITGNYITLTDVVLTVANSGVIVEAGVKAQGTNITIDNCEIYGVSNGVLVQRTSVSNSVIQNCYIRDLTMQVNTNDGAPPGADDDYGAIGVHVQNASNVTVRRNTFKNIIANSFDYGVDGTCLEIYANQANISNVLFQGNYIEDSLAFTEFGGTSSFSVSNVTIDHNIARNIQGVAFFHVGAATAFQLASITNVQFQNNTIHSTLANLSGTQSVFGFAGGNGAFLTSRNNIFAINAMDFFDFSGNGGTLTYAHSNNLYSLGSVSTRSGYTTAANEYTGDPLFADAANKNYNLTATSPALSRAATITGTLNGYGFQTDFAGIDLTSRANLDIGAVEYNPA